jgi:hypothetical protein
MEGVYFGEIPCQNAGNKKKCENPAYYKCGVRYVCGVHSRNKEREMLPKNPDAEKVKKRKISKHLETLIKGDTGFVTATKMRMMKNPVPKVGFLPVFPNNKHGHGFGYSGDFSSLSPMKLGPVLIENSILALNIENYHQFAKVFPNEVSNIPCNCRNDLIHNKPLPIFYEQRTHGYSDAIPHRHKYESKELKKLNKDFVNGNVNIPMYSVQFVGKDERHYTYLESRYFYCTQMEILATKTPAFQKLITLYKQGHQIEIFGYDAYEPVKDLYTHYCDSARPFGHEMVILSLIRGEYPWKRYHDEHFEIYN